MKEKYRAVFIVPVGANKVLGESGWEFESSTRLPGELKNYLIQSLRLRFLESYLGIESYADSDIKMSVIFDGENEIESIYFQVYGDAITTLFDVCKGGKMACECELFFPQ